MRVDVAPLVDGAVAGIGPRTARYAVVGPAPLSACGEPLGVASRNMLAAAGIPIEDCYLTVVCRTVQETGKPVTGTELAKTLDAVVLELGLLPNLERVLVLGADTARVLCPGFEKMAEDHGTLFYHPHLEVRVVPTYLPVQVARDTLLATDFARDIERFLTLPEPVEPVTRPWDTAVLAQTLPDGARVSLDIETDGTAWADHITMIGLTWPGEPAVFVLAQPQPDDLADLLRVLAAKHCTIVGSFLQFDLARLYRDARTVVLIPAEDTTLMAHSQGELSLGLKHLTTKWTDRPGSRAYGSWKNLDVLYLAEDVLSAQEVAAALRPQAEQAAIWPVLCRLVPSLAAMQYSGIYIDRSKLAEVKALLDGDVAEIEQELARYAQINWASTEQVADYLQAQGIRLWKTTKTGAYSLDDEVLRQLGDRHPVLPVLRDYRERTKTRQFVDKYEELSSDEHPYLHPTVRLYGARTGRTSCTEPNIQQSPNADKAEREAGRSIKRLFRSRWPGGSIGVMDLSQIELRILALLSGDTAMAEALQGDIHTETAVAVLGLEPDKITKQQRTIAKRANFGKVYGQSAAGLVGVIRRETGQEITVAEAQAFQDGFDRRFPSAAAWIAEQGERGYRQGYVDTIYGRRRYLQEPMYRGKENKWGLMRKAVNTPIQSAASDTMLVVIDAVIQAKRRLGLRSLPVIPVHDSLVVDIYPGEEAAVVEAFRLAFQALRHTPLAALPLWGRVPITGEYVRGETWEAADVAPIEREEFTT